MNLAARYYNSTLTNKIRLKGRDEQELQHLFPSLYGNKAVTRNTIAVFNAYDKKHFPTYTNRI